MRLPAAAAAVTASAIPALGITPGGRPRTRSGFQEAGGGAFQPSLAVASAPSAPIGRVGPFTGSLRAPSAPGSSRGRGARTRADGSLGAPRTCRAAQVAAHALRLWALASAALRAPRGGGRGGAAPVPAPFNFAAAASLFIYWEDSNTGMILELPKTQYGVMVTVAKWKTHVPSIKRSLFLTSADHC